MPIKKISSVITVSILCANMLTFTSFADSDKNNFELNQEVNNLNINTEELQNTEDIQINSTDAENSFREIVYSFAQVEMPAEE